MYQSRYRPGRARLGVSLIEALMVVLLLSATAAAAVFRVSQVSVIDPARQSAQSFTSSVRSARELAITRNAAVTLTLDLKSRPARWVFASAASGYGPASTWDLPIEGNAEVDGTTQSIRLDGNGNASYFGEWKFRGTAAFYVSLEPIGAKVTMKAL